MTGGSERLAEVNPERISVAAEAVHPKADGGGRDEQREPAEHPDRPRCHALGLSLINASLPPIRPVRLGCCDRPSAAKHLRATGRTPFIRSWRVLMQSARLITRPLLSQSTLLLGHETSATTETHCLGRLA